MALLKRVIRGRKKDKWQRTHGNANNKAGFQEQKSNQRSKIKQIDTVYKQVTDMKVRVEKMSLILYIEQRSL